MDYNSQPNFGVHSGDNNYSLYDNGQQQSVDTMGADNEMLYDQQRLQQQQQTQYDQVPNDQSDYWNQQHTNEVSLNSSFRRSVLNFFYRTTGI